MQLACRPSRGLAGTRVPASAKPQGLLLVAGGEDARFVLRSRHWANPSSPFVSNPQPASSGRWIRTCMGLFLSSRIFWFVAGSLFGAGKPFFVPSPAIRFAERAEGVKGPKR